MNDIIHSKITLTHSSGFYVHKLKINNGFSKPANSVRTVTSLSIHYGSQENIIFL